jgi:hypothetical protein
VIRLGWGGINTYLYVNASPLIFFDAQGLTPSTGAMPNPKTLQSCPEPCEVISKAITDTLNALKRAWVNMFYDLGNQYNNARYTPVPGSKTTWEGHKKNFYALRNQLRNQIDLARKFKFPVDAEAERWSLYGHPPMAPGELDPGWMPPF